MDFNLLFINPYIYTYKYLNAHKYIPTYISFYIYKKHIREIFLKF